MVASRQCAKEARESGGEGRRAHANKQVAGKAISSKVVRREGRKGSNQAGGQDVWEKQASRHSTWR